MRDPLDDFAEHDREKEEWLRKRPVCCICGEHIQQEDAVCISDRWICDQCLKEARKWVEE